VSQIVLVTIGTADGEWAPPRPVEFELTGDLNIVNAEEAYWPTTEPTRIRYVAAWIRGRWCVAWAVDLKVARGQGVAIAAGDMSINVEPPSSARVPLPSVPTLPGTGVKGRLTAG
jgi:hypothetical protein